MRSDRGYHQGKAQSRNENTGGIAGRSAKQEASGHLKKNTGSKETENFVTLCGWACGALQRVQLRAQLQEEALEPVVQRSVSLSLVAQQLGMRALGRGTR